MNIFKILGNYASLLFIVESITIIIYSNIWKTYFINIKNSFVNNKQIECLNYKSEVREQCYMSSKSNIIIYICYIVLNFFKFFYLKFYSKQSNVKLQPDNWLDGNMLLIPLSFEWFLSAITSIWNILISFKYYSYTYGLSNQPYCSIPFYKFNSTMNLVSIIAFLGIIIYSMFELFGLGLFKQKEAYLYHFNIIKKLTQFNTLNSKEKSFSIIKVMIIIILFIFTIKSSIPKKGKKYTKRDLPKKTNNTD